MSTAYPILNWESPDTNSVGETVEQFLHQLEGPTWFIFPGKEHDRSRVIVTLLHGNEPSGLHALHDWILSGETPHTDLYCFVGSVAAAQEIPVFHYRMLPKHRDLNRCFRPPFNDQEGVIAADLLHRLTTLRPEAVIDVHNTSGAGPAFSIATNEDPRHQQIAALFTNNHIVTDLRLGSLMEFDTEGFTVTTIECGGAHDPHAHNLACDGFKAFARTENLFTEAAPAINLFHYPVRVELIAGANITISEQPDPYADLTLHSDSERLNFSIAEQGTDLGWLGAGGLDCIVARDSHGNDHVQHYFENIEGKWLTKQPLKLFMVTRNADIAMSDCLFYFVPATD